MQSRSLAKTVEHERGVAVWRVGLLTKFFTHQEHAESFLDGQIIARRLHVLRTLEDGIRHDPGEGQFVARVPKADGPVWIGTTRLEGMFFMDDDIELEVGTRLPKNMQRLRGEVVGSVPAIDRCNVLCLSQPSRADLHAFVKSNSMGNHAVVIHNPRVRTAHRKRSSHPPIRGVGWACDVLRR